MGNGKNALKLPGDHIDFNLNLKIILLPLFDARKKPRFFLFLVIICSVQHFLPTRNTGEQENRNYE